MLYTRIQACKDLWFAQADCPVRELSAYMKARGKLRAAQIDALETYLFLKIRGGNKPLWQLAGEGLFSHEALLTDEQRDKLQHLHGSARALGEIALETENGQQRLPELAGLMAEVRAARLDCDGILRRLFYDVAYPDYLFSLPMGAGKTYLMAAMIYLDLHFALQSPNNPLWGHSFLALIPSGLKSSITASLCEIREFDGSWVLPAAAARRVRHYLNFEVLDVAKSGKKSNRLRDPNADKVNRVLADPFGQIFVVNAEKLITRRMESDLFAPEEIANELRAKLAEIPQLGLLLDEAHHAAKSEVRLRQVVNWWASDNGHAGSIAGVASFSGTPYLRQPEIIDIGAYVTGGKRVKSRAIANTVYFYSLSEAISRFLKRPTVRSANASREEIIRRAVQEFKERYGGKTYRNGAIAKCAIYCGSIETLEQEVHPLLLEMGISDSAILKYHGGNKTYKLPAQNAEQFRALDLPGSPHRYVLLVQIGKEGWNCKSLAAVALSGEGDSPKNMVLQTCCRCLRQVDDDDNTALIWLNRANERVLDEQLNWQQATDIAQINEIARRRDVDTPRHSRMAHLALPAIDFYQLRVRRTTVQQEATADTPRKLQALLDGIEAWRQEVVIRTSGFDGESEQIEFEDFYQEGMPFHRWVALLSKNSFGQIRVRDFMRHREVLQKIHQVICTDGQWNQRYDLAGINNAIALAFSIRRTSTTELETVSASASILIEQKLAPAPVAPNSPALYPDGAGAAQILQGDQDAASIEEFEQRRRQQLQQTLDAPDLSEEERMARITAISRQHLHAAAAHKDRTLHYVPYYFSQSRFEKRVLEAALALQTRHAFEIYYNGERGLTQFVIECFEKSGERYAYAGRYTPDFLIVRRDGAGAISQALILETKGRVFGADEGFARKKRFVSGEFIIANNQKFNYRKFDYLYLEDSAALDDNVKKIHDSINHFFSEDDHAD